MRVAIYVRVSTRSQTVENQLLELRRVAEFRGWRIVREYKDEGISGAIGSRPALDQMIEDARRHKFDLVACWSVDRLGRSLQNVVSTVNDLNEIGVNLYFHTQSIDSSTSSGRLMLSIFASLGSYEREQIKERIAAGLARAKAQGKKLGRPSNMNDSLRAAIVALHGEGMSIRQIAAKLKVGCGTVYRTVQATKDGSDTKVAA